MQWTNLVICRFWAQVIHYCTMHHMILYAGITRNYLNCTPMNCLSASLHSAGFTQFLYVYCINEQSCALWKTCCILYQLFSCHFSYRQQMLVLASNKDLVLTSRWWMLLAFLRHNWTRCAKVANCSTSPPLTFNTCTKATYDKRVNTKGHLQYIRLFVTKRDDKTAYLKTDSWQKLMMRSRASQNLDQSQR